MKAFIAWFPTSTPAKSFTWQSETEIIDQIPGGASEMLSRFERLSLMDEKPRIFAPLFPPSTNNRIRVLTLNMVEFVVFGFQTEETEVDVDLPKFALMRGAEKSKKRTLLW